MRLALLAAVSLCAALGGCIAGDLGSSGDGDGAWGPLRCDPSGAGSISRNAPLAAGLQGDPTTVAQRIANGIGDPLGTPAGRLSWSTAQGGLLRLSLDARGAFYQAVYEGPAAVDLATVERLLAGLAVDLDTVGLAEPGALDGDGHAMQLAAGEPLGWRMAGATWSPRGGPFSLVRFYDLGAAPAQASIGADQAAATARSFAACASGGSPDADRMWLGVLEDSLAHVVAVGPPGAGCEATRWVYVDAVTGAVVGAHAAPCG